MTRVTVPGLDAVLSDEGWPYASAAPTDPSDSGRFHALFGRDALVCSLQLLPVRPDVARASLRALAERQGTRADPETDEEPGKIGHEFRADVPEPFVRAGYRPPARDGFRYYGTADATSWWLVVLNALGDRALADALEPAWRAAAGWLDEAMQAGGGYVRSSATPPSGSLSQQGWRDAVDPRRADPGGGILRPDGTVPKAPMADADTQAVTYAALRAVARLSGDDAWRRRGDELAERIEADFGPEVMALDGDGVPAEGAGSQLGWLLWSGAVRGRRRDALADRLVAPDVLTPFGLRTLSSESPVFDPFSYHRGSVWPFDSWLGWSGLRGAGREREAEQVRSGVLAALRHFDGAPELYAVTRTCRLARVPIATWTQAWTVGARWALAEGWDGRVVD